MTYDGYNYIIRNDEVTIVGYDWGTDVLNIPKEINGYPVTEIGGVSLGFSGAFEGNDKIRIVRFPSTIKKIGYSAFADSYELCEISLPTNSTHIDMFAFRGCDKLTSITIPDGVRRIEVDAFSDCKSLKDVYFMSCDVEIGKKAFDGCEKITFHCYEQSSAHKYALEYSEYKSPVLKINLLNREVTP
jgi:hypothetical protein